MSVVMKIFILFTFLFPCVIKSQVPGGLGVNLQYNERIEDARYNDYQLKKAYKERYDKLKSDYVYMLGYNELREIPKVLDSNGNFEGIVTDMSRIIETADIIVENNKVKYIFTRDGKKLTPDYSSEVVNFRAVISFPGSNYLEIIFTFLFK